MLLSISWLKDFITDDIPVHELADKLTMAGIEVEEIIQVGDQWNNIVVGEILDISPHPNADSLSLTTVGVGDKNLSVVCGAPNIQPGIKVPLAVVGAELPNGLKIKRSKIRGTLSEGMICSETEIGIGDDSSGIMVLPPRSANGTPIAKALALTDTVLDLGITPNRSDCLSIVGLAREISAIFDTPLSIPAVDLVEDTTPIEERVSVEILDSDLCPRYTARLVNDVVIQQSPLWMRRRLENSGIRSINNVVDITNYVLLEWGQPLHAFDLELVGGAKIIVRRAHKGEHFVTLDKIQRSLDSDILMICDAEQAVAIAGIMGGQNSGVSPTTTSVLLESAYFNPSSIARSSRFLQLKTEAAQRFEKGVDMHGVTEALHRAAALMSQLASGNVCTGFVDEYPNRLSPPRPVSVGIDKVNTTTGLELKPSEAVGILKRLSIEATCSDTGIIQATAPSYRYDLNEPIDFIEEIARIKGYNHIPVTFPKTSMLSKPIHDRLSCLSKIRDILTSCGFFEVINYSFYSQQYLDHLNFSHDDPRIHPVNILNPLSASQSVLRTTLVPSLLCNLRENMNYKNDSLKIFEISNLFFPQQDCVQPQETRHISGLMAGTRYDEMWNLDNEDIDFYDIKGAVEILMDRLHINQFCFKNDGREPFLHPKKMLSLYIQNDYIGCIGMVHPDVLENFEIEGTTVAVFTLDFGALAPYATDMISYTPFSRYPAVVRDIALVIDDTISAEKVDTAIGSFKNKLIQSIRVFDNYTGDKVPNGKKSLAYRITFQSPERTLTDGEVNKVHDRLVKYLNTELGTELRH